MTQALTTLVERTQAVTILRDALYRLSEAYANKTIDEATYSAKFDKVLKAVTSIAKTQEHDSATKKAEAENKLLETKRMMLQPQQTK